MKDRVEAWKHAFEGDELAVLPTLINFTWNYAAFITVIQIVRQAPDDEEGRKRLNTMILDLIAGGYWANAVLAIRRLVDRGPFNGKRGVISLWSLLQDIKASRNELTRTVYVETIAGLPYDYEVIREKYWEFIRAQPPGGVHVPKELWYEPSEERHAEFDWLSGTAPEGRSPTDLIREDVFARLEARLSQLDQVADHATVYFAHSASEASREGRVMDRWGPNEAKVALQQLAQTAEFVGRWFCYTGVGDILPTAQYNQFEFLDEPFWHGDMAPLHEQWEAFGAEVSQWPYIDNEAV